MGTIEPDKQLAKYDKEVCITCEESGQNSEDEKLNRCWCGRNHKVVSVNGWCKDYEPSKYSKPILLIGFD